MLNIFLHLKALMVIQIVFIALKAHSVLLFVCLVPAHFQLNAIFLYLFFAIMLSDLPLFSLILIYSFPFGHVHAPFLYKFEDIKNFS